MRHFTKQNSTKFLACLLSFTVTFVSLTRPENSYAQGTPPVSQWPVSVKLTHAFNPPVMVGLHLDLQRPLRFDFIFDRGDHSVSKEELNKEILENIKYFLASLTIPEKDMWVNLSPYEKNRIIPVEFGKTEMGNDLLAQDYILKQLTASLLSPENELGKNFWEKVYAKIYENCKGSPFAPNKNVGARDPNACVSQDVVNMFNKVWIVPEKAIVQEKDGTAWVLYAKLKVMLGEDYLTRARPGRARESYLVPVLARPGNRISKNDGRDTLAAKRQASDASRFTSHIIRQIILPEIEKEVNEGEEFAPLRQIFHSMILATWYKQALKESLLVKVYADQGKVKGLDYRAQSPEQIYQKYLEAFKKGTTDLIREEYDPSSQQIIQRKYFVGGFGSNLTKTLQTVKDPAQLPPELRTEIAARLKLTERNGLDQAKSFLRPPNGGVNPRVRSNFNSGDAAMTAPSLARQMFA